MSKKRMSLYFNLEDEEDRLIWEHLERRKKSNYVKRLILNDIYGTTVVAAPILKEIEVEAKTDDEELLEEFPDDLF